MITSMHALASKQDLETRRTKC